MLPAGVYTVEAWAPGFVTVRRQIVVRAGAGTSVAKGRVRRKGRVGGAAPSVRGPSAKVIVPCTTTLPRTRARPVRMPIRLRKRYLVPLALIEYQPTAEARVLAHRLAAETGLSLQEGDMVVIIAGSPPGMCGSGTFMPHSPTMTVRGMKIVAMMVSTFITSLMRLFVMDRCTSSMPLIRSESALDADSREM